MKPLFYYKWYWQDWRANRTVQRMTYIERGLYRELLDECWIEGCIPTDIKKLSDICGCPVEVMADAWQVLSKCFVESDGVFINERLEMERTGIDAIRANRARAGKQGGIAKLLNQNESVASAKQVPSTSKQVPYSRVEQSRVENTLSSSEDDNTAKIDYQGIVDLYNRILPELPTVKIITQKRRTAMKTCATTKPRYSGLDFWEAYFTEVRKSDFLMGRKTSYKADFDFLVTHSKFIKTIEGAYN